MVGLEEGGLGYFRLGEECDLGKVDLEGWGSCWMESMACDLVGISDRG